MSWRNNKKEPPSINPSGSWTDNNTKKSKFSVSGLLKGKSSRKNYLIIVGILFVLALLLGIATIILISTQSQGTTELTGTTKLTGTTQSPKPYNPLIDPDCSNCTCYANIDLALDATTDLTSDAFKLQNEFVNYYISKLYDPQLLANDTQVIISYGVDGGNFGIKWPNIFVGDRTLDKYFKDGDILKKQQDPGKFNDLYNILLSIFLNNVNSCTENEFLDCYDGSCPQNNIVFMGSPSKTAPSNNILDLTFLPNKTYNGTKEINLTEHYLHGPKGRNKLIVILMKEDTAEKWNKTNLQEWLDAGLHVLQYKNDTEQLLYDLREQLSCVYSDNQTYIDLSNIKNTSFSNAKFTTTAISKDITISKTSTTRPKSIHQNSTKKQN